MNIPSNDSLSSLFNLKTNYKQRGWKVQTVRSDLSFRPVITSSGANAQAQTLVEWMEDEAEWSRMTCPAGNDKKTTVAAHKRL